jgi:hypothetical protein
MKHLINVAVSGKVSALRTVTLGELHRQIVSTNTKAQG